ncbi:zinc ribbon domain-containing protein [Halovenus salina]|uniref:Zinc ribbon domain-containing protein n=1 Tax=Halovenus salina TaxID=1510225 RepID=A0ABD5VXU2_9EURY|nr:zinc ribbon domain-containing protein [Halovenus salina]
MADCPACGTETAAGTKRCPNCGETVVTGRVLAVPDVAAGVAAGAVAFVLGFVATAVGSNAEESRETVENLFGENGPLGVGIAEFLPEWYKVLSWEFLENTIIEY